MNPILILTHNCLELTKKCVESTKAQDIPTYRLFVDNGSTDGTKEWIRIQDGDGVLDWEDNDGVSLGWNMGLDCLFHMLFDNDRLDHVLVLNNDTIIPPHFYRTLLECNVSFVTGMTFTDMTAVNSPPAVSLTDGPDFSAFLIRRECWEKVGPFDESMVHYCSDVDYDIRARRLGIMLYNSHVKFYHERSSTLSRASAEDRARIQAQSHRDHEAFRKKYGCLPSELGNGFWGSHN